MLKGVIVFMDSNKGSKSECLSPYLYTGNGEFVKIRLLNDNPFENNELKEYDGEEVVVEGEYNDNKLFLISDIAKSEVVESETESISSNEEE